MRILIALWLSTILVMGQAFTLSDLAFISQAPSGSSYDTDAQDYFTRVEATGATLTTSNKTVINSFVLSAKADNYWTNLIDCSPFAGSSLTGALVKLKYTTAPSSVTNVGFVAANYADTNGITSGAGKYLLTGVNNTDVGAHSGLSFFLATDNYNTPGQGIFIGSDPASSHDRYLWFFGSALYVGNASASYNPFGSSAFGYSSGLYHLTRPTDSTNTLYINGVRIDGRASSSATARSTPLSVFAGGGVNTYAMTNGVGAWYGIDDGQMDATKAAAFGSNVMALVRGLGRRRPSAATANYVPWYGQSLSIGYSSGAASSTSPDTNGNRMPTTGTVGAFAVSESAVLQANFPVMREYIGGYETPVPGFALGQTNIISATFGKGGAGYANIKRGTTPYTRLTNSIRQAFQQSQDFYSGFIVTALPVVHGETDLTNLLYDTYLYELRTNFQADVQAITGQTNIIPLFSSQIASWTQTGSPPAYPTNVSSLKMLEAYKVDPTNQVLVCPKYFLDYISDGLHLTNSSYKTLGQYYQKAYRHRVISNLVWQAFYPTNVARSGATVTLTYPTATDMMFDTNLVSFAANYGFEWYDSGGPSVGISSVALAKEAAITNQVVITLSGTPSGSNFRVRYAYTGTNTVGAVTGASKIHGPRGNLRKNEATLPDWGLVCDEVSP